MRQHFKDPAAREKNAAAQHRVTERNWPVQSCGKRHAQCRVCRPDIAIATSVLHKGKIISAEHRVAASVAQKGRSLTFKHRAAINAGLQQHGALDLPSCKCVAHGGSNTCVSALSGKMIEAFLAEFPTVIAEKRFGSYRVDAYLPPPYHLAFEADGEYWHSLPGRKEGDAVRDVYLLVEYGLPTVRLSEDEINVAATAV